MISHPVRSDPRFLHIREHATNTNNAIINNKYKYKYIIATPLAVWPLVVSYKRAHNKLAISGITCDVVIFEKAILKNGAQLDPKICCEKETKLSALTKSGVGQTDWVSEKTCNRNSDHLEFGETERKSRSWIGQGAGSRPLPTYCQYTFYEVVWYMFYYQLWVNQRKRTS